MASEASVEFGVVNNIPHPQITLLASLGNQHVASVRENARRRLALRAPLSCRGTASSPQPQPIDRRRHARGRHRSPQPSQRLQELFNNGDAERVPDERVPLRRRQRRRGGVPARHSHQALLHRHRPQHQQI